MHTQTCISTECNNHAADKWNTWYVHCVKMISYQMEGLTEYITCILCIRICDDQLVVKLL